MKKTKNTSITMNNAEDETPSIRVVHSVVRVEFGKNWFFILIDYSFLAKLNKLYSTTLSVWRISPPLFILSKFLHFQMNLTFCNFKNLFYKIIGYFCLHLYSSSLLFFFPSSSNNCILFSGALRLCFIFENCFHTYSQKILA